MENERAKVLLANLVYELLVRIELDDLEEILRSSQFNDDDFFEGSEYRSYSAGISAHAALMVPHRPL